jgi:hypothetical protein
MNKKYYFVILAFGLIAVSVAGYAYKHYPYWGVKTLELQPYPGEFNMKALGLARDASDHWDSPDGTKRVVSDAYGGPLCESHHAVLVVDAESATLLTTLNEADSCSGRSFYYTWSSDSRYLMIYGRLYGEKRNPMPNAARLGSVPFSYLYDTKDKVLYEVMADQN